MPSPVTPELVAGCTRFLSYHHRRSVRNHLQAIADSPLALLASDGYGRGGFVAEFEAEIATLLGKQAAVFMPSGTMAQQIALRIWAEESGKPRVAFHPTCHLEVHEQGAYHELQHLAAHLLGQPDRLFNLADLEEAKMENFSTLLIELPQREIGGQLPTWSELIEICGHARSKGARLHLDGARLWECQPFYQKSYAEISAPFDSVYVSFYKILGGLPGAMLAAPKELIEKARIWQRRHGGNLVSLASNAISAKLGLDEHLPRIPEYVAKAQEIASILGGFDEVHVVPEHPPTNMMHLHFAGNPDKLLEASARIAAEDKVLLFAGIGADAKMEVNVGDAALDIEAGEMEKLFAKLFDLAR